MEHAIEASVRLAEPLRHVRAALADEPGLLVGAPATGGTGPTAFEAALAMDLGGGTKVQQALVGELGPSVWADDALELSVQWQPASHEHVLPAFSGVFCLTAAPPGTLLVLRGAYTIPLGAVGRMGDRVAGRRLAQRVLDGHLAAVSGSIDEAARRAAARRADWPDDGLGSENFIG